MSLKLAEVAVRVQETAGLTISTTVHAEGTELFLHQHRRPYFCFVMGARSR